MLYESKNQRFQISEYKKRESKWKPFAGEFWEQVK
jgi:hypothetical protein